jgi:YVTN family beta-propeller protein
VSIGAEDVVKVYTTGPKAELVETIHTGALPHGVWPSGDGSRIYVGLENGDAVDVIDTATNKVIKRIPAGQAPQALIYLPGAVKGDKGLSNLKPRMNGDSINVALKPTGKQGTGFMVVRHLGLVDAIESFLFKLKPMTVYDVYVTGQATPIGAFKTNDKGMANGTAIGPVREASDKSVKTAQVYVVEEGANASDAVLRSE